jgi:LysR family transcriptional regulator, cyn operon transcriptional activator
MDAVMELRHLRYFLAVADSLSFTRAAADLHITQPTLSQQIAQLEQEIGTTLFDRVGRKVRLTASGALFRQHAERALREIQAAKAAVGELEGLTHGALAIGVFQSFNASLLPPVLAKFTATYPRVTVTVRQLATGEMEERLLKGELDLGIAYGPPASDRVTAEKLFDEPLAVVVAAQHPLAKRRDVRLEALAEHPLALLTPEFPSRRLLAQAFAAAGVEPQVRIEINSTDALLATVQASGLATIQTRRIASAYGGLRCIALTPRLDRSVAIFWRRDGYRSAAARAAAQMIREAHARQDR